MARWVATMQMFWEHYNEQVADLPRGGQDPAAVVMTREQVDEKLEKVHSLGVKMHEIL